MSGRKGRSRKQEACCTGKVGKVRRREKAERLNSDSASVFPCKGKVAQPNSCANEELEASRLRTGEEVAREHLIPFSQSEFQGPAEVHPGS